MPNSARHHCASPSLLKHKPTFDAFVTHVYLPCARTRKKSWELDERLARRHISPVLGSRRISDIAVSDIELWLTGMREKGLGPASCNRVLAVLKSVFSLAEKLGFLSYGSSPCRLVKRLKAPPRKDRFLSIAEGKRLMAHLRGIARPEALAIQLLLLTGARKSEILGARWEDLDLDNRMLTVPLAKSGKPRRIYLSAEAIRIFRRMKGERAGWIFPSRKGDRPVGDLYYFWNRIRRELGLGDVRLHDLRHSYASFLVSAGHTLYEAQQLLGHSEPRTTMRYAHFAQDTLAKAAGSVALLLKGGGYGRRRQKGDRRGFKPDFSTGSVKTRQKCLRKPAPGKPGE